MNLFVLLSKFLSFFLNDWLDICASLSYIIYTCIFSFFFLDGNESK